MLTGKAAPPSMGWHLWRELMCGGSDPPPGAKILFMINGIW